MSWCPYDSSFLLTCAKDNRTICWDTHSGEVKHRVSFLIPVQIYMELHPPY